MAALERAGGGVMARTVQEIVDRLENLPPEAPGFQICPDILNDYETWKMSSEEFVRQFERARRGDKTVYLYKFVRPWNCRLPESQWAVLRSQVFKRDDYTCQYCGERGKKLECDHVVPVSKGGGNELENLKTACRRCNRNKRDKDLDKWMTA